MFLIFGLRAYFRTIGQGTFHCQRCGGDRGYRERTGRRWFHLFFIPLIPLLSVGEHVRCSTCHTSYRVEVLAMPTAAQMQAALPAGMRAAATAMLRAGDPSSPVARRRAIEAISGAGLDGYDDAALDADLASSAGPDWETARPLNKLALQLAVQAREWLLADLVRIGLADGLLSEEERHAARQIAANLGMTVAQAYGVISMTEESATAE
jgi:tellurite resistance protein